MDRPEAMIVVPMEGTAVGAEESSSATKASRAWYFFGARVEWVVPGAVEPVVVVAIDTAEICGGR